MAEQTLPILTNSFLGRAEDLRLIQQVLTDPSCHLLTLVGAGGIGKTRLAIEIAMRVSWQFPDGCVFVPLQPIASANQIPAAIASALGIQLHSETEQLAEVIASLKGKRMLLIIDNFEHVSDGTPLLADLIAGLQAIRFLVTSRETLNLQNKWLHHVRGMRYPEYDDTVLDEHDAVQLFVERARQAYSRFSLDDERKHVIRICRLTEGMPLAIELAASWIRHMACADVADEIAKNVDFLSSNVLGLPDRHYSIRVVFNHSWGLLDPDMQESFLKLSVFRGGFTRQAAQEVTGASLPTLCDLVDKSLIHLNADGRYDIHELLRQYADEMLSMRGTRDDIQDSHAQYYLARLHALEDDLGGAYQAEAALEIDREMDNLRFAWGWAAARHFFNAIVQAIDALNDYVGIRTAWLIRQQMARQAYEAIQATDDRTSTVYARISFNYYSVSGGRGSNDVLMAHMRRLIEILEQQGESDQAIRARIHFDSILLDRQSHLVEQFGMTPLDALTLWDGETGQYGEEALAYYRETGNRRMEMHVLSYISMFNQVYVGDIDRTLMYRQQCLEIAREVQDWAWIAHCQSVYGFQAIDATDNLAAIEAAWQESYDIRRRQQTPDGIAMSAASLSVVKLYRGKIDEARELAEQALRSGTPYGWRDFVEIAENTLAYVALYNGQYEEARRHRPKSFFKCEWIRLDHHLGLVMSHMGSYQPEAAEDIFQDLMAEALAIPSAGRLTQFSAVTALLLVHRCSYQQAAMFIGFSFDHRHARLRVFEGTALFQDAISQIRSLLGDDAYLTYRKQGAALDAEVMWARILRDFQLGTTAHSAIEQANQALVDPLTERELHILQLLATGMSNQAIADDLVVTLGTVKKHNNNIFSKLNALSRTDAVKKARDRGLVP